MFYNNMYNNWNKSQKNNSNERILLKEWGKSYIDGCEWKSWKISHIGLFEISRAEFTCSTLYIEDRKKITFTYFLIKLRSINGRAKWVRVINEIVVAIIWVPLYITVSDM